MAILRKVGEKIDPKKMKNWRRQEEKKKLRKCLQYKSQKVNLSRKGKRNKGY